MPERTEKKLLPGQRPSGFAALSKKEKDMIWILIIVVAAAAMVWFLILPQRAENAALVSEVPMLEEQKALTEQTIARLSEAQQEYKTAQADYDDARKKFQDPMNYEEVDALITKMLTDSGFVPETLSISALSQETVTPYALSAVAPADVPEAATEETAPADDPTQVPAEEGTESLADVQDALVPDTPVETAAAGGTASAYTVNVSVKGTMTQFYALLGKAEEARGVTVASYSWTAGTDKAAVADGEEGASPQTVDSFAIVFKIYVNGGIA
ncbi:MAG: hypothetical protein LBR00_00745 [Clostridiales Family XIII bacterium]|jgi:hypothetical protein|nr:hypothetical protein [Clostridiales Family XIII bacterium]